MKAILLTDIGTLEYSDVPTPDPGPGGLLVRVESCAICATDIRLLEYGRPKASPTTRDFTAEGAENTENGRKQGNGVTIAVERDSKDQRSPPFSAFSAISAVKK